MDAALQWQSESDTDKKCTENWQERALTLTLFDNNDYGAFDDLLPNSGKLLSVDEFRQLAWRFENEARRTLNDTADKESYNFSVPKEKL